ncbi:MAG: hypothetical protein AB7F31_01795 [Parachlamydiales bacterium]
MEKTGPVTPYMALSLPLVGAGIGALVAFNPWYPTSRLMKGALITLPAVAGMVIARALQPKELDFSPRGCAQRDPPIFGKDCLRRYGESAKRDGVTLYPIPDSTKNLTFGKAFVNDLHRQASNTFFVTGSDQDPVVWQMDLQGAENEGALPAMVEKLRSEDVTSIEIERLCEVWFQGPALDGMKPIMIEYNVMLSQQPIIRTQEETLRTDKIWRGDLGLMYQTESSWSSEEENPRYFIARTTINVTTGFGEYSYRMAEAPNKLQFDLA